MFCRGMGWVANVQCYKTRCAGYNYKARDGNNANPEGLCIQFVFRF